MARRSAASCGEIAVWDVMLSPFVAQLANGVNDCVFHPSPSTNLGRGRTVATARQYMKVTFEDNLHTLYRAHALFRERMGR